METVLDFIFWGSKITADGDCSHEIKRRLQGYVTLRSFYMLACNSTNSDRPDFVKVVTGAREDISLAVVLDNEASRQSFSLTLL